MNFPAAIKENVSFLLIELKNQLQSLIDFLNLPTLEKKDKILERKGYLENLKQRLEKSTEKLRNSNNEFPNFTLRSVDSIAQSLARISELARNCTQHWNLNDQTNSLSKELATMVTQIASSLDNVEKGLFKNDTDIAIDLGKTSEVVSAHYQKLFNIRLNMLKKSDSIESEEGALLVAYELDQMSDCLLEISEIIISNNFGQPLSTERFFSLQRSMNTQSKSLSKVEIRKVAETRSGSGINSVSGISKEGDDFVMIVKDGHRKKLKREKAGVESWHEIFPGLAPQIIQYQKDGEWASLLIEHLDGLTFEQIILQSSESMRKESLNALFKTLRKVWAATKTKKAIGASHMSQLKARLSDVYDVHPRLRAGQSKIGKFKILSLENLIAKASRLEKKFMIPFSVYIHGDFNIDKLLGGNETNRPDGNLKGKKYG